MITIVARCFSSSMLIFFAYFCTNIPPFSLKRNTSYEKNQKTNCLQINSQFLNIWLNVSYKIKTMQLYALSINFNHWLAQAILSTRIYFLIHPSIYPSTKPPTELSFFSTNLSKAKPFFDIFCKKNKTKNATLINLKGHISALSLWPFWHSCFGTRDQLGSPCNRF